MKFFIDTANAGEIKKALELGVCDGVTTNPTLVMKAGKTQEEAAREIARLLGNKPLSVEVISDDAEGMVKEAEEYVKLGSNIVIKIPMTKEGMRAVRILSEKGIKTNVTLVFSVPQALIAAKAGATYVSPFVGRLDDIGENGMELVRQIVQVYTNYKFKTEIIVASVRSEKHVVEAALAGAHIATIPPTVLEQLWHHPLTEKGIKLFKEHYEQTQKGVIM
ncbi:MAG: fructose-6-phosphate aldolase [Candidatus Bilamarchaeaceae archaeon]